jgi:hypothetical protein
MLQLNPRQFLKYSHDLQACSAQGKVHEGHRGLAQSIKRTVNDFIMTGQIIRVRTYACFPVVLTRCASALNARLTLLKSRFTCVSREIFAAKAVISVSVSSLI